MDVEGGVDGREGEVEQLAELEKARAELELRGSRGGGERGGERGGGKRGAKRENN